jgi:hypothetical protein
MRPLDHTRQNVCSFYTVLLMHGLLDNAVDSSDHPAWNDIMNNEGRIRNGVERHTRSLISGIISAFAWRD